MGDRADSPREHLGEPPLTVVVPVYNEGENFREWWKAAAPHLPSSHEVRVVYDFEEDDTLPVTRELALQGEPVRAMRNRWRGARGAILTGLKSVERGPVIVSMADLSDDFPAIPAMLREYARGARVVVASRYMPGGRQLGGPWLKGQLSRWGGKSLHFLAGFPVRDATNSFRLYDARLLQSIDLSPEGGFEIGFELTIEAWRRGETIAEVPATWHDRTRGASRFALARWLPRYASLWGRAVALGWRKRLGLG